MKGYLPVAFIASFIPAAAVAQTTMPLDTGYNYSNFSYYPVPSVQPSPVTDNYWIKIASFEPPSTSPPPAPASVLNPAWVGAWQPLGGARWLGPRPTVLGGTGGTNPSAPAYYIYRKCFCLMARYQKPALSFQLRADNESNAWLNTTTNVLVPPSPSSFSGQPLTSHPTNPGMFHAGLNCVYVLVQNTGGPTGFSLSGTVSATGLMPIAGAGVSPSFAPCQCSGPAAPATASARAASGNEQAATLRAIVAFAEARRREAAARH